VSVSSAHVAAFAVRRHDSIMARDIMRNLSNRPAKQIARLLHSRAVQEEREGEISTTAYRRAMDALDEKVNRESKTMKPEMRKKLKDAKDELRRLSHVETHAKGSGAPKGHYLKKEKAKSRRSPTQPFHAPNKRSKR
jgi:hypothetical protein